MRVRMKARAAGPGQDMLSPGDVVEVDDETAEVWLAGGYAVAAPLSDVERQVLADRERAVAKPARTPRNSRKKATRPKPAGEEDVNDG